MMIRPRVFASIAAVALLLSALSPNASLAQGANGNAAAEAARPGRSYHGGGAPQRYDGGFVPGPRNGGVIAPRNGTYYTPGYVRAPFNSPNVVVVPVPSVDQALAYCMQNFPSYDPWSGTYLDDDGRRHFCP